MVQHYQIIKKIGAGGMGEVYLAEDTKLKRRVAAKFLPAHLVANDVVHTRFVREAQTLAKLNHPNIVSVHDVNEFEGRPFYVMELVEGESLQHYAQEKPLHIDSVVEYTIQICQGLGEAHRAGIVHRDIKSANIAVDKNGRVRLLDFGLAANEEDDRLTKSGSTLGTVSYMSPEQVSGREIDQRSDLFSLGVVIYELVTGKTPFKRDSEGATLNAIMQDIPEPLTRYKSNIPEKLQDVVTKLLEKDKEIRYQSAEGVIADLKRLMYDSQQTGQVKTQKQSSFGVGKLVGIAAIAIILVAAIVWKFTSHDEATPEADHVPRIAVLPFENLGSASDEYFADGITDEITTRLAGISGLGVISRTSSMKYKGSDKTTKQIGTELNVDYILNGTVRWSKAGGNTRVRISPTLARVSDDRQLWGDNYERELLEVFTVQADIAEQVVNQLGLTLVASKKATLEERPTNNAKAYEYYLKGLSAFRGLGGFDDDPAGLFHAKEYLDSAVLIDPNFASAFAIRSMVYSVLAFIPVIRKGADTAYASVQRAQELDPKLPEVRIALGMYYNLVLEDYDRALEQYKLARSEVHSNPDVISGIAFVHLRQGKFEESQEEFLKAAELDPLSPQRYWALSQSYWIAGDYEEGQKYMHRAMSLSPKNASYYTQQAFIAIDRYGKWEPIDSIYQLALKNCDTLTLLEGAESWKVLSRIPGIDIKNLINRFGTEKRKANQFVDLSNVYTSLAAAYEVIGDTATSLIYLDSLKHELELKLQDDPTDPHHTSALGLVFAAFGDCDRAVEYGERGKELLSVEKCHW